MFVAVIPLLLALAVRAEMKEMQSFSLGHASLIRTRLDPIVNPGAVAGHVHSVSGSSAFSEDMTYDDAAGGNCTTSPIQADMSNYWVPQLYYKYRNGSYYPIQGNGLVVYWKYTYNQMNETFAEVPSDFRMLGGNITRDFLDPKIPSHDAVSWQCFGPGYDYRLNAIPADFECENIRPQVFFPACWNGEDSYLPDNSHVAYPLDRFEGGRCPESHPRRIVTPFVEAYYMPKRDVPDYEWYPGCLVLSNGDNYGLTYHADWLNGWPKGLLIDAFNNCNLPGTVNQCELFESSRDDDKAFHCRGAGSDVAEDIGLLAPIPALPGNNPEFNSSALSPNHKKMLRSAYVETAQIVPVGDPSIGKGTPSLDGDASSGEMAMNDPMPSASSASASTSAEAMTMDNMGMPSPFSSGMNAIETPPNNAVVAMQTDPLPTPSASMSPSAGLDGMNTLLAAPEEGQAKETVTVTKTVDKCSRAKPTGAEAGMRRKRRARIE